MIGHTANPMLQQAEQGIQAKVKPELQDALTKVLNAGLTIMYSPQTAVARNKNISNSTDPVKDAGEGAARMVLNLYRQSGKKMPVDIVVPAAMIFAFEYLDLLSKAGKADITPDLLAKATKSVADSVLPLLGITKDKLKRMIDAAPKQGIISGAQGA